jgi:hypothetical protein
MHNVESVITNNKKVAKRLRSGNPLAVFWEQVIERVVNW